MRTVIVSAVCMGAISVACSRPGGPGITDEFGDASVGFVGAVCQPVTSADPLPARASVTMPQVGTGNGDVLFTAELYNRFDSFCGACHNGPNTTGFSYSRQTFTQLTTLVPNLFDRIESNDPSSPGGFMPPSNSGGKAWKDRLTDPNDAVVALDGLLHLWVDQGSPVGSFSLHPNAGSDGGASDAGASDDASGDQVGPSSGGASQADYTLTPTLGASLTNIGSCIPNKYSVGVNIQTMDQMDAFFATATALPPTLDQTDLITFDSDTLARNGVISYYPAYPLWSDNAGKMRHVRTPHNQPITFDPSTQKFTIPANTRFYKTFFKEVVDVDGNKGWKRIETRLIVSRPDQDLPDGTVEQTALFGTYVWDETETKAALLTDPLHNGKPFTDRLIPYVADDQAAQALRDMYPDPSDNARLNYALNTTPGVIRHYAIPGSERCIECHMGSPSAAFILGFTPLQVAPLPPGTSGVIEPATSDELTQLQRLIDFKVISGMTSGADVTPLEDTQLPRTPRNDYELKAQAYMVGNCAHCHNPRGFPSTKAPELKSVLNFLPGPDGGIFQFPLDRTSPVRSRGFRQDVPIPYITPSLRDLPGTASPYKTKYVDCNPGSGEDDGWCANPKATVDFIDAPWRSLLYRNVDTPFDYVDDSTIFPHMPLNTPGYDCRVTQIMGDWMVSIPATRVNPQIGEDINDAATGDLSPQPYVEVKPGDPGYKDAQAAAQKRLASYHAGHRYNFCPNTTDIVDPAVLNGDPSKGDPETPSDLPFYNNLASPPQLIMPEEGVPDRPHWVVTDATDPPGDWLPRGTGWESAIVQHVVADPDTAGAGLASLQDVLDQLTSSVTLDAPVGSTTVRSILTTEVPFGVWKQKPGCNFSGIPAVSSFQGDSRPPWMDKSKADPGAPVYLQTLGAGVFTNICINCHGPNADAKGLLADEISIMTGGNARVANFKTGLFGPLASPGANRARVFVPNPSDPNSPSAGTGSPEDYGARYMAWMALGGTLKVLPPPLLTVVATTPVLGVQRTSFTAFGTANMLQLAKQLCTDTLLSNNDHSIATMDPFFTDRSLDWTHQTSLIGENGDAELWLRICSLSNRPVVRVILPYTNNGRWKTSDNPPQAAVTKTSQLILDSIPRQATPSSAVGDGLNLQSLYWGADATGAPIYPANAPVMDHRGRIVNGITSDNLFPVCIRQPADSTEKAFADAFLQSHPVGGQGGNVIPYCPEALFAKNSDGTLKWALANPLDPNNIGSHFYTDANHWANRGAINAGLAVFLYVDQLSKGNRAKPAYNQCELLGMSPAQ